MATLLDIVAAGAIVKLAPILGAREQEERVIYASPKLLSWIQGVLPTLSSNWNISMSPLEQFIDLHSTFAAGECLVFGNDLNPLHPIDNGIWELKTADLRVFGWFVRQDCMIAQCADTAANVKNHNLYVGYRDETVRFRNQLNLSDP